MHFLRPASKGTIALLVFSIVALVAAGCANQQGGSDTTEEETTTTEESTTTSEEATTSTTEAKGGGGNKVVAELSEYAITPDVTTAKSGQVTFTAKNTGNEVHEFVVIKTDLAPDKLPVKNDAVDESGEGMENMGEVEDVKPGKSKEITLNLKPGKYVLICNITTHYGLGMRTGLTVK